MRLKYPQTTLHLQFALLLLLALSISGVSAQTITNYSFEIRGGDDKKVLPYAHVVNMNNARGTISNLNGKVVLNNGEPSDTLHISFIGYEPLYITIEEAVFKRIIYLKLNSAQLGTVEFIADNQFLYKLIYDCRLKNKAEEKQAKSYFTLRSEVEGQPVEYIESYFNGKYAGYNLRELYLKNGRLHIQPKGEQYFVSTEVTRAIIRHGIPDGGEYFPISPLELRKSKFKKAYDLRLKSRYWEDNVRMYVVDFKPKEGYSKHFSGTIWIDSTRLMIHRISLVAKNPGTHPFLPLWRGDSIAEINLELNKEFKQIGEYQYTERIDFKYDLLYKNRNDQLYSVKSHAVIYAFDYDSTFTLPYFEHTMSSNLDYLQIHAVPYNDFFWEHPPNFSLPDLLENDVFQKNGGNLISGRAVFGTNLMNNGFFEHPYKQWSAKRIFLRSDPRLSANTNTIQAVAANYDLEMQVYLDMNRNEDSLHVLSSTIFDPFKSYYYGEISSRTNCFVNIYFDLVEIERRKMMDEIKASGRTETEVGKIYNETIDRIGELKKQYLNEVNMGFNDKALIKWNDHVKEQLHVNNMEVFNLLE